MEVNILELPLQEKNAGNEYWKNADYLNASKSYSKCLLAFNHLIKENKFENEAQAKQMIEEIQLASLLNLAACYLKLGYGYSNVVIHCTDALKIQENNIKALYRRANAHIFLEQFQEAKSDIFLALKLEPANDAVKKIKRELIIRENAYKEKTRKIAQKAFGGSKKPEIPAVPWWKCCRRQKKN